MSESIRQRKKINENDVQSSNDDINRNIIIDRDDRQYRNQSSIPMSQMCLGIVAISMIALLAFIQFGLPHEDHMTKHFPASLPTMDGGPLLVNDFLAHSERIYVGEGPESIEPLNGLLYTGLKNGSIVEFDPITRKTRIIYSSLSVDDHLLNCGKDNLEHICGRPLGIRRFSDNELIVVQAYHEKLTQLISADDPRFGSRPLRFVNDVDVLDGRYLFFTDSDWLYPRKEFMSVLLRADPRGRLIRFDLETGKVRILNDQLSFPNGVQLSIDKQSVLVCETTFARIIRHWISGNNMKIGKSEIFIDNLPGIPDNIRLTSTGNYWIAFAGVRHVNQPSFLDRLRNWPRLRAILSFMPGSITKIFKRLPHHGIVIELDKDTGHIIRSLHDAEGLIVPSASQVTEYNGYLYFGSYYLDHIAIMLSCLKGVCCLRFLQGTNYPDVIVSHRPEVILDTSRMGQDVVVVKNGRRLCGTGAAVANAPIVQNKAYFEVKLQTQGTWGIGLGTRRTNLSKVPLGYDSEAWIMDQYGQVKYDNKVLSQFRTNIEEGDVIGFAYDHETFRIFVNGTEQEPSCRVTTRGTVFPIFYVDEGAILDIQFSTFYFPPPEGYDRILLEKSLI
ncbi:unnamed protein product [Rotaria sp. Silwood1]|nr:unnamed protein product [Rotaria sp. Silwood1]